MHNVYLLILEVSTKLWFILLNGIVIVGVRGRYGCVCTAPKFIVETTLEIMRFFICIRVP